MKSRSLSFAPRIICTAGPQFAFGGQFYLALSIKGNGCFFPSMNRRGGQPQSFGRIPLSAEVPD